MSDFRMRVPEDSRRELLLERVEEKMDPITEKRSRAAAVTKAIEKGLEWMEEREQVQEQIEAEERKLEERREKWNI